MRHLKDFVEDFVSTVPIPNASTPLNTMGMGNISVSPVGSDGLNTEPLYGSPKPAKKAKKKRPKSLASIINEN